MADDFGDKTEAPTPRRRQEAREEGNVARSTDLTAAVLLLGILLLMNWYGPGLMAVLRTLIEETLSGASLGDLSPGSVGRSATRAVLLVAGAVAPLFLGTMLVAVLVNVMQVGLLVSTKRMQPKLSSLNPLKGLKRILGEGNSFAHLAMNVLKVLLVGAAGYSAVAGRFDQILALQQLDFVQIFALGAQVIYAVSLRIAVVLLVLAIIDYAMQRFRLEKQLMMTKEEVKEEMRRMEGDPKIKARRRQIAQQMAQQRMKQAVPTADVVVTNPTHIAVALKYDSKSMHAPKVVAKGQGYQAQRIREIAIAAGVPIIERKPLARALFKMVEVGQEIPEEFYSVVAEILAYVYELSGKMRRRAVAV